jgi:gamma-glutamyltranspeptidase/glutathione hydrolase
MFSQMFKRKSQRLLFLVFAVGISVCLLAPRSGYGIEPFTAPNGMAVSGSQLSATAALRILQEGGNAIDAMVAMYAVMAISKPDMAGPAGGGWALIYHAKSNKVYAIDMDSYAPALASPEKMRQAFKEAGWKGPRVPAGPMARGPLAAAVPGNLKGWEAMLDRFGTMTFAQVFKPAIELAEKGFGISTRSSKIIKRYIPTLSIYPTWYETFTIDGRGPAPGERMYRKNLANTYKKVAALGADVVYKGEIADEIDRYFREVGGWIRKEDLAEYDVVWSDPLKTTYTASDGTEYTIYGNLPPSSSIEVLQTLKILDGYDLKKMGHNSVEYLHTIIEATKLAHYDNYRYVGDTKFVDVPMAKMISELYAAELRKKINPNKAMVFPARPTYPTGVKTSVKTSPTGVKTAAVFPIPPRRDAEGFVIPEVGATTHSIVGDRHGNIITMTNTLGTFYGAGFVIGNTGLVVNNGIDWMDIDESPWFDGKSPTAIEPGKRNRWTLSPVLVFKDGKPFIAIGGAGAETTAQGIVQPILNVIEFGMNMQQAIDALRFRWGDVLHYTGGQDIWLDKSYMNVTLPDEVREGLLAKGHNVIPVDKAGLIPFSGNTNAMRIIPHHGTYMSGQDARPGSSDWAVGY